MNITKQTKCQECKYFGGHQGSNFWCNKAQCKDFDGFEKKYN